MINSKVTIKIPRPLYLKLKKIIKQTGFESVTDFIVYCLRDIVVGKDGEDIKERLRKLGYLK